MTPRQQTVADVERIIANHTSVHPTLLRGSDIRDIRRILRSSEEYKVIKKHSKEYRWWTTAVRDVLGFDTHKRLRAPKGAGFLPVRKVMPAMRAWAEERAVLTNELPDQKPI